MDREREREFVVVMNANSITYVRSFVCAALAIVLLSLLFL